MKTFTSKEKKEFCPLIESAKMIGDTAMLLIIKCLSDGPKRYGEIKNYVDMVSEVTLGERLKKLCTLELVTRKQFESIPPKVEYTLTQKAEPLLEVISKLEDFGEKYFKDAAKG